MSLFDLMRVCKNAATEYQAMVVVRLNGDSAHLSELSDLSAAALGQIFDSKTNVPSVFHSPAYRHHFF